MEPSDLPFDTRLLGGFSFECRRDCALCCYTTPAVTPEEERSIRATRPDVPLIRLSSSRSVIGSRPGGGACRMLVGDRCSIHTARPGPCAAFPISVHGGPQRWQASVVLACPGVALEEVRRWADHRPRAGFTGLDAEVRAARARMRLPQTAVEWREDVRLRRRARRRDSPLDPMLPFEACRTELRARLPWPEDHDLPGEVPPTLSDGPEYLPLVWEGAGRVAALEGTEGGLRRVAVRADGFGDPGPDVFPWLERIPPMTDGARTLLRGYLNYWLERDALFDLVLWQVHEDPATDPLPVHVARELRHIGATVLARASMGARARGQWSRELGAEAISWGIRATDMDLLDRPGFGVRL